MGAVIDKAKGKIKRAVGRVTGDTRLEREGEIDETKGKVEGVIADVKGAVKDAGRAIKDAVKK